MQRKHKKSSDSKSKIIRLQECVGVQTYKSWWEGPALSSSLSSSLTDSILMSSSSRRYLGKSSWGAAAGAALGSGASSCHGQSAAAAAAAVKAGSFRGWLPAQCAPAAPAATLKQPAPPTAPRNLLATTTPPFLSAQINITLTLSQGI